MIQKQKITKGILIGLLLLTPTVLEVSASDGGGYTMSLSNAQSRTTGFAAGTGAEADPYLISTAQQLKYLSDSVNDGSLATTGVYFSLTGDIDLNELPMEANGNWVPIGNSKFFNGTFNGQNHTISNMTLKETKNYNGLFGGIQNASIKNLNVSNASILTPVGSDKGLVVGYDSSGSLIENVTVSGKIEHTGTAYGGSNGGVLGMGSGTTLKNVTTTVSILSSNYIGGIVGSLYNGTIENANTTLDAYLTKPEGLQGDPQHYAGGMAGYFSNSTLTKSKSQFKAYDAPDATGYYNYYLGGLVAEISSGATIKNSTATVDIQTKTGGYVTGGLVGKASGSQTLIENSYALGLIKTGLGKANYSSVGGLFGTIDGTVKNSYSAVEIQNIENATQTYYGGIAGIGSPYSGSSSKAAMTNTYWNQTFTPIVAINNSAGASAFTTGLNEEQMVGESAASFVGFDFVDTWKTTCSYPVLKWEEDPICLSVGDTLINGDIQNTVISFTVPTALSFEINSNLEVGQQFVAPTFRLTNESNAPLSLSVSDFKETTNMLTDVLSTQYTDKEWANLSVQPSPELAIGIQANSDEGWLSQTQYELLHAITVQELGSAVDIGTIKAHTSVTFDFAAKHGTAFKEAMNPVYQLTFIFDLFDVEEPE